MFLWVTNNVKFVDSAEECPSTSGVTLQLRDANARDFTIRWQGERQKQVKKARRLPLLQAQSSIWNRLSLLNKFLMFLHKFNEIFRVNWWWISDCRASSILKTVPVSQDSKEYAWCKRGEFVHNNTKPLFRIAWHFWTNTKYSGEVSLIISVDIHREWLSVSELEYFLSVENIEISRYVQARQSLLLLTQGNIYNRFRFLNKYLMFLEELNELLRENWSKFLTAGYLVFWKQFAAAGYLDTSNKIRLYVIAKMRNSTCQKILLLKRNNSMPYISL